MAHTASQGWRLLMAERSHLQSLPALLHTIQGGFFPVSPDPDPATIAPFRVKVYVGPKQILQVPRSVGVDDVQVAASG